MMLDAPNHVPPKCYTTTSHTHQLGWASHAHAQLAVVWQVHSLVQSHLQDCLAIWNLQIECFAFMVD